MTRELAHVAEALRQYAPGVHRLGSPASLANTTQLPTGLGAFYQRWNGVDLFHESLRVRPVERVEGELGRWDVAELGRDTIYVDHEGAVWRLEGDTGDLIHDGTSFDRWLDGWVDGESILYDTDGEFLDFGVDENGELTPQAALDRERRAHKHDSKAAGPWWRLARALARTGDAKAARAELEGLVAEHPGFGWAWFDLARISEQLGEADGALQEAVAAAQADPDYEHAGYFWAHAARLAAATGDEARRAQLAARALDKDPDLARTQRDGAATQAAEGNVEQARELLAIALALAPRDVAALALRKKLADLKI